MPRLIKNKTGAASAGFDPRILELAREHADGQKAEHLAGIMATALQLGNDQATLADLKLFRRAFSEMRYASSVFAKYTNTRKVAVFGSARTKPDEADFKLAVEFAAKMVERGFMIITGGGDGIMGAAQQGAGAENSFGLNIRLPFEQRANETIDGDPKLINFNYFFTRKLHFLKETHAVVLFPGGFGTQDEGFEALTLMQTGKSQIVPVILIDRVNGHYWETWRRFLENDLLKLGLISPTDFHLFSITHSADDAVAEVEKFYSVFHSYRWVREQMVIRLNHALTEEGVAGLNDKFKELLVAGQIVQHPGPLPEEKDDVHLAGFKRLILTPDKHKFGLIRLLIDAINNAPTEKPSASV